MTSSTYWSSRHQVGAAAGTNVTATEGLPSAHTKLALAATPVTYDVNALSSDYIGNLKAVVQAQDALYKATSAFILNPADYEGLVEDLGSEPGGVAYIVSGSLPTFMGHEIIQVPYMPSGQVLFTPPQNIVMGINRDIQRYREIETSKRAIEYTFDMATDFAFLNDAAVVIGYNVT